MSHNRRRESSCSTKKTYKKERLALAVAENSKRERGVELRVYRCGFCSCFHLTSSTEWKRA